MRQVGRPDAPAAQSPSQAQLAPSGRLPGRTQKPLSEPPPHRSGPEHTRHSSLEGAPLRAQWVVLTSTHVPCGSAGRQHWPAPHVPHVGGATQRTPSQREAPPQLEHESALLPQFEFEVPAMQLPNASQQPRQLAGPHWLSQVPPTQALPGAHVRHATPSSPQFELFPPTMHVSPTQQPLQVPGPQRVATQRPNSHVKSGQVLHATPPSPHAPGELPP